MRSEFFLYLLDVYSNKLYEGKRKIYLTKVHAVFFFSLQALTAGEDIHADRVNRNPLGKPIFKLTFQCRDLNH